MYILFWNFDGFFRLFFYIMIFSSTLNEHMHYMSALRWGMGVCINKEVKNLMVYQEGRIWQKYNQCTWSIAVGNMNFIPCRIYTSDCILLLQYSTSYPVSTEHCPVLFLDSWQHRPREKFGRKPHIQRALSFEHTHVLVLKPGDANTMAYCRNVYRAVWRIQFLEKTDDVFAVVSKYTVYGYWWKWGTQSWGFNSTELILVLLLYVLRWGENISSRFCCLY